MVLLKDLFKTLASGEFSNLSFSNELSDNVIGPSHYRITEHLNLGLIEIYKRFRFLQGELRLHADPSVALYQLTAEKVATPGNIDASHYIESPESTEGFLNILELLHAYDDNGLEVAMNRRSTIPSIRQLAPTLLKITGLESPQVINFVYQASPTKIVLEPDTNLDVMTLAIPLTIIEPLLFYVAARVYKPVGANNSTAAADKSASYQQQYELSCQKLDLFGLDVHDNDHDDHFTANGWV